MPKPFRRLPVAIAILAIAALAAGAHAADASSRSARAEALAAQATSLMDKGKNFNQAAALLQTAIKLEPRNSRLHSLLGCAYADRAASIAHALVWQEMLVEEKSEYPKNWQDWRDAQSDPKSDDFGSPPPQQPHSRLFPTKDDGKLLTISSNSAGAKCELLAKLAMAEWKQATTLAKPGSERAASEYTAGWGALLLHRSAEDPFGRLEVPTLKLIEPNETSSISNFTAAIAMQQREAIYWQSLGDAIWINRGGSFLGNLGQQGGDMLGALLGKGNSRKSPSNDSDTMVEAYKRSLALKPGNGALAFRLYRYEVNSRPSETARFLRIAVADDRDVAQPYYDLATIRFHETHFGDVIDDPTKSRHDLILEVAAESTPHDVRVGDTALSAMVRGNACRRALMPPYAQPVPICMKWAWHYSDMNDELLLDFPVWAHYREMARDAMGFAYVAAHRHDETRALRAARVTIGAGKVLMGHWPVDSSIGDNSVLVALVGSAISSMGYSAQLRVAKVCEDGKATKQAQAARDNFRTRMKAYKAALRAHPGHFDPVDFY